MARHAIALSSALLAAIEHEARERHLSPELLEGIVRVESGGDPWAWNPEPHYRYLVDASTGRPFRRLTPEEIASESPPGDFPSCPGLADDVDAEWWGQQASWGPMQVMGAVAREHGFRAHFPRLCQPAVGVHYGALHLASLKRRFSKLGTDAVIAAYNAGSPRRQQGRYVNQHYVDKVRAAIPARRSAA